MNVSRRNFLKRTGIGSVLVAGGILPGFSAASYRRIIGSNDRINLSIVGVNNRGRAMAVNLARLNSCRIGTVCDVDNRAIDICIKEIAKVNNTSVKKEKDFRKSLEDSNIDAVVIALPDHWHTPAAIMALQAGKHVYLEKPISHNPREGELLVEASLKYNKVIQIGNQRRSWPNIIKAVEEVRNGSIGKVHFGKMWYANDRMPIGTGKVAAVPEWFDWNLWQGPAPRMVYKDNIVHYNWHWFWHWGTAESGGNGVHMIDLLCWGMNLKYPKKISSMGGRYYFQDDWETPDTQVINMEYDDAILTFECNSCNNKRIEESSVGVIFYGEKANLFISGGNDYKVFDKKNKLIKEVKSEFLFEQGNTASPSQQLDEIHFQNFFDAILKNIPLACTVEMGHQCTLLMQLGNIAYRVGRTLVLDPSNGHIIGDTEAQGFWSRTYEPGWEPKI